MYDGIDMTGIRTTNPAMDWAFLDRLRKTWKGKLFIKGMDTREDARLCLEHGVDGILVPRVTSVDEASAAVRQMTFSPAGDRGIGITSRAGRWGGLPRPEYLRFGDEEVLRAVQLEERAALEAVEEILDVAGLNGVFLGMGDLQLSSGLPESDPSIQKLVDRLLAAAQERKAAAPLKARLEESRAQARVRMLAMLDSEATRHWLETLNLASADFAAEPVPGAPQAAFVMPERVRRRYRKLKKAVRRLDAKSSMRDHHTVRRRAKQLRYAIECGAFSRSWSRRLFVLLKYKLGWRDKPHRKPVLLQSRNAVGFRHCRTDLDISGRAGLNQINREVCLEDHPRKSPVECARSAEEGT